MTENKSQNVPVIALSKVTKEYCLKHRFFSRDQTSVVAVNNIDLKIEKGEIFGLVGQSGSGKTTAGRILVKLENPSKGLVKLNGKVVNRLKAEGLKDYRSRVQMIFQDPYQSLNPHLSISETILEPLIVNRIGNAYSRKEKVMDTLDMVGLAPAADYYNRFPHQLSGGQRQRVAIARAIVLDPEFVVADEPTSMLDATIAIQLFQLLKKIRQKYSMAFLFITHNLAAAKYLCDRIAVINNGVIVETGDVNKIIQHPEHPYTKQLIKTHPGFHF